MTIYSRNGAHEDRRHATGLVAILSGQFMSAQAENITSTGHGPYLNRRPNYMIAAI
jgi:hypothetical protein